MEVKENRKYGLLRKLLTLVIIVAVAWLLGQMAVPALLKAVFL